MTLLLENRTISMILTVPDVEVIVPGLSHSFESLDHKSSTFSKTGTPPSIPIYHGSIIRIEQHRDNQNASDLIVRVPNFHHLSLPSVTISNFDQLSDTQSLRGGYTKRRAPICPILNDSLHHPTSSNRNIINNLNLNQREINSRQTNTKRIATGLRSLSRIFITNCKSKRSASINEVTIVPVLPDVEVITEHFEIPTLSKKSNQNQNSSKLIVPKILFIKRKNFKRKRKHSSSTSIDTENNTTVQNTNDNSRTNLSLKDNENEPKPTIPIKPDREVKQQSTTIAQLIPNIPTALSNRESSSTHRFCMIPGVPQITMSNDISSTIGTENEPSSNHDQKMTLAHLLSEENVDSTTTDIQSLVPIDNDSTQYYDGNIEERLYVVHPNGETYSECYEVTYELDPQYQNEQIYLSEIQDQSSIPINIHFNPFEYQDLASTLTSWLPILPSITQNDRILEQNDRGLEYLEAPTITNIHRVKFRSLEDLSQISYQPESVSSSSKENDHDTSVVNEDYTVILQFIRNALQMDIVNFDAYNEFKAQIEELYQ